MSKKPRSKRINISVKDQWKQILKSVNKNEVPVNLLQSVTVNLIDGTSVEVDIQALLKEGHEPDDVRDMLNGRLDRMDALIRDIDFLISIDAVAKTVQPFTNELLKHLQ
jgi:hypothetical protein